jgi:hypothetical protein
LYDGEHSGTSHYPCAERSEQAKDEVGNVIVEKGRLELVVSRNVRGSDGTCWTVQEMRAHDVPGALHTNCLIFDAKCIVCRFWFYPDNWLALSDHALLDLLNNPRGSVPPS